MHNSTRARIYLLWQLFYLHQSIQHIDKPPLRGRLDQYFCFFHMYNAYKVVFYKRCFHRILVLILQYDMMKKLLNGQYFKEFRRINCQTDPGGEVCHYAESSGLNRIFIRASIYWLWSNFKIFTYDYIRNRL